MLILGAGLYACLKPIPVNAEMIGDEPVIVQEDEQEISVTQVAAINPDQGNSRGEAMRAARHDLTTEVKKRKYPKLRQIKYGQALNEFHEVAGPAPLKEMWDIWPAST